MTKIERENWNDLYTIEFYGTKGWEVIKSFDKTKGLHEVTFVFLNHCVNNDGQYRLTTPK